MRSLLQFLKEARQIHLRFVSGSLGSAKPPIYVVGNPSADLDSMISAIVYSYFAHRRTPASSPRSHIPLLNLPGIPSGKELCRLRPEFVKALWFSTSYPPISEDEKWENTPASAGETLKEHIVTVSDFSTHLRQYGKDDVQLRADITMVDWNALPVQVERGKGSLTGLENVLFTVVGYLDHHDDEKFVPHPDTLRTLCPCPSIIQSTGSCASLVVTWLEGTRLLQEQEPGVETNETKKQLALLALSPILIDTANLTSKTKTTDVDITAVDILSNMLCGSNAGAAMAETTRSEIYNQILETKQNGLDLLTVDEILDRDFKQWTEKTARSQEKLEIGFCTVVKPIQWIVGKAGSCQSFLDCLSSFSRSRRLDIVVVMTAFNSTGQFCRELFVCALNHGVAVDILKSEFVPDAVSQLDLRDWYALAKGEMDQEEAQGMRSVLNSDDRGSWKHLWIQRDVGKSRKQVAPLLRSAVARY